MENFTCNLIVGRRNFTKQGSNWGQQATSHQLGNQHFASYFQWECAFNISILRVLAASRIKYKRNYSKSLLRLIVEYITKFSSSRSDDIAAEVVSKNNSSTTSIYPLLYKRHQYNKLYIASITLSFYLNFIKRFMVQFNDF